jgi:uncharacterized protein involved in oxidation of intracellular sulfur
LKALIILNDPPYGTERSYNGIRLANELLKQEGMDLTIFLMADAVFCAKKGQITPDGYYNLERMLKPSLRKGAVLLCGSCMDARGLADSELIDGARRSTMAELTNLTIESERVLIF